jgi:hypothetical protein
MFKHPSTLKEEKDGEQEKERTFLWRHCKFTSLTLWEFSMVHRVQVVFRYFSRRQAQERSMYFRNSKSWVHAIGI